jgi:hypothetical protein
MATTAVTPTPLLSVVVLYSLIKPLWPLLAMLLGKTFILEKDLEAEEECYISIDPPLA